MTQDNQLNSFYDLIVNFIRAICFIMNKAIVLKIRKEKKSKSDFDLTSKNQFMDVKVRFNTLEIQQSQQAPTFAQKSFKKYTSLSPDDNVIKKKKVHNRSVKQILAQIKAQQKRERQNTAQVLKREFEEKIFENRLKQFEIAEKRIKRRLQIQQKRVQSKELDLSLNNNSKVAKDKQKQLIKSLSVNEFEKDIEKSNRADENPYSDRKMFLHSQRLSESKLAKYSELILPSQVNQQKKSQKNRAKIIKPHQSNMQKNRNFEKLAIKKRRKVNLEVKTLAAQKIGEPQHIKYIQYASPRNKRTIEHQLQRIYRKPTKSSYKRAAELVDKMSVQRRLKLKNNQQMDYVEANNKIKLLNYFYEVEN